MRVDLLCLVMAVHLCSLVAPSRVHAAPAASTETSSNDVTSDDLALGQPLKPAATPAPDSRPARTQTSPSTTTPTVVSPALASTALVADRTGTTSVVDIRLLPKRLPYRGEQAMDGYVLEERPRWWMIISGGVLFATGYVIGIAAANERDFSDGMGFSAIPIAGPWISLAMVEDCSDDISCSDEESIRAQLLVSGVFQLAGAVLLPIGLSTTRQAWVRKDLAVSFGPARVGRSGYGAVFSGTF